MPYPYWNRVTQSNHAMMIPQVQCNSTDSSENATSIIDLAYDEPGHDDTKPDITDLLSDMTRIQENIDRNHDNNEWIDVAHLQHFQPSDDVTGIRKDGINKMMGGTVTREQTQPPQKNLLKAMLLADCTRTEADKRRDESHIFEGTLRMDLSTSKEANKIMEQQQITTINIEDSEDEVNEDSGVEWVNDSVGEDFYSKDSAQMKNNTGGILMSALLKEQRKDETRCSSSVEEKTAASQTTTKYIKEITPNEGRNQNEEMEREIASVKFPTDNPEKTTPSAESILERILMHPQPTQGLLIETIVESILRRHLSGLKQKGEVSKGRVEKIQDIVTPGEIKGKQKQPSTIIIEDSDKDEEEVIVEEKIEIEENLLQPGVQYEISNHDVIDNSVAQSCQAVVPPQIQCNTLDSGENTTPSIQQIFSCRWYKCMPCSYSTGIADIFQTHLESETHKNVEIRTNQSREHSLMERNSKMLDTNVNISKRKEASGIIKQRKRRKRNSTTSSRRMKNEKQTAIIIEDSDKDDEDNIETEENVLRHKQCEKDEVAANNLVQQTCSSELYKCDVCHYSTKMKLYFQVHLQSERHECALQEKQNEKSSNPISNKVKTKARRTQRKKTCRSDDRNSRLLETSLNAKRKERKERAKRKQRQERKKKQKTTTIIIEDSDKEIEDVAVGEKAQIDENGLRTHTQDEIVKALADKSKVRVRQECQSYECDICHFATRSRLHFQNHLGGGRHKHTVRKKSGNSSSTNIEVKTKHWYKCAICHYKTRYKDLIDFHFQSKYHVDSVLAAATSDKRHANKAESDSNLQKEYNCSSCTYVSKSEVDLKVHLFDMHSPRSRFKWYWCNICKFKTRDRISFKYHLWSNYHQATVSTIQVMEKFELGVKESASEMTVDEVIEDVEEDCEEVAETNQSANNVDWTETEVFVEEEESECIPEIFHCGHCNFVTGSELELQRHIVEEHRVFEKPVPDSCSLKITDSNSIRVLGEELVAQEKVITEECEDWTEINVEEDTSDCECIESDD